MTQCIHNDFFYCFIQYKKPPSNFSYIVLNIYTKTKFDILFQFLIDRFYILNRFILLLIKLKGSTTVLPKNIKRLENLEYRSQTASIIFIIQ